MQFVLRLRTDVRAALNSNENSYERIQAFSTYLHENIHWWQHVGSNFGFLYSLSYPATTTLCINDLKELIKKGIIVKPIVKFDAEYYAKYKKADIPEINRILNTYYDIEYAKLFSLDNKIILSIVEDKRFFLSIGHSYNILWNSSIHALSSFDEKYEFLPKINSWVENFRTLQEKEIPGFGIDIPFGISPLGIKAIYEGQAIFNQLQYLAIGSDDELTFEDFEKAGMLYGIYMEAFEVFLKYTKFTKPITLTDPLIGLFLLLCDIAINPTNGFPLDIYDFENFIIKNDPGIRFYLLCNFIGKYPDNIIKQLSIIQKMNI